MIRAQQAAAATWRPFGRSESPAQLEARRVRLLSDAINEYAWDVAHVLCATDDEEAHLEAAQLRVKTMTQARNQPLQPLHTMMLQLALHGRYLPSHLPQARNQGNFDRALQLAATEAERASIQDYRKEVRDVTVGNGR